MLWQPNPGPQTRFLASSASEVLYGGAAAGGKSAASVALPLRFIGNPRFNALVLRRETPQLADLIEKSTALYPKLGGRLNASTGLWRFESGARVWFTHCATESDVERFDGHEYQLVVFDELTHFSLRQYTRIRARIRGTDPALPRWTRATTNPGGPGHDWVFERFGAWLNPEHPNPAAPGEVRWFDGGEETTPNTPGALSRLFIPAKRADNPHVSEEYAAQLRDLDPVRRAQLADGNWLVKPAAGLYFKAKWITQWLDAAPRDSIARRLRMWDFGATSDGDWTIGARLSETETGLVIVEHVERLRGTPAEVRATFKRTAQRDREFDPRCVQVIPQDPAQAGKDQVFTYQRDFPEFTIRGRRPQGDKVLNFSPFSARQETGAVAWVRGPWTREVFAVLEEFPDGDHDDDADAIGGAFRELQRTPKRTKSAGWSQPTQHADDESDE